MIPNRPFPTLIHGNESVLKLLPVALAFLALSALPAPGETKSIRNSRLEVRCDEATLSLEVRNLADGRTFLKNVRLSGSGGASRIAVVDHQTPGDARSLEITHADGSRDRVSLQGDQPFVFFQPVMRNGGTEVRNVKEVEAFSAMVDAGAPAAKLKAWGTAGLTAVDGHSGSYVFLALADPDTRNGVVGAWLTHERGSGIVFSGRDGDNPTLRARIDYGRLLIEPKQEAEGETFAVGWFDDVRQGLEQWADLVAKTSRIRLLPQQDGYCTWYSSPHGGAADEKSVVELAEFAAKELKPYGFGFVQIDDKWQDGKGHNGPCKVFVRHNPNGPYPNGMKGPADRIRELGLTAGLWFMPFAGDHEDAFFADKMDWFAHNADGSPYFARWGGTTIDMSNPKAREYLADIVKRISHEWGYKYFKMDGMWVGTATKLLYVNNDYKPDDLGEPKVFDPKMTPIEIYRSGLRLVRQAAGPDVFILGCCVSQNMRSFGGTFGLVDAMRIGPDNGSSWDGLKRGPWHGGNRYFLHGRVWYNDPDPVYVRPGLPAEQSRLICSWVGLSGQLHASSDWLPAIPPERLEFLKRVLPSHGRKPRPVDILENELARIWLLTDERGGRPVFVAGLFNWDEKAPAAISYPFGKLGLKDGETYVGFDYWANRFVPPFAGQLESDLAPATCRILALRPATAHPQVVSTSRHITQGVVDLAAEAWDEASATLTGKSRVVAGDPYEIRIVVPSTDNSWVAMSGEAAMGGDRNDVAIKQDGPQIRASFTPAAGGEATWTVRFKRGSAKASAPRKPEGLTAEPAYRRATLNWSADGALAFRISRSDGKSWQVGAAPFVDAGAEPGAAYRYRVEARGWDAVWSEAAEVAVTIPAELKKPPRPPAPKVHLSDIKPVSVKTGWGEIKVNQSCEGKPLTIEGKKFEKGMGVHADSLLVYAIPKGMKRFVAVVGLDDEKKDDDRSSVVFKVYGDVKEMGEPPVLLAESPVLKGESPRAWHFDVKLTDRMKELRLSVEDAGDGIASDHADWADAGFTE